MPPVRRKTNGVTYKINTEARHQRPHIHLTYGEYQASVALDTLEVLAGSLPAARLGEALAWIAEHREVLTEMYQQRFTPGAIQVIED